MRYSTLFLLSLLALGLFACGGGESSSAEAPASETAEEAAPAPVVRNTPPSEPGEGFSPDYSLVHRKDLVPTLQALEEKFGLAPFFIEHTNPMLFLVTEDDWALKWGEMLVQEGVRYGLATAEGNAVLPLEYDKIYNADATAKGYIEVEQNGKRGLFNYQTNALIPAEYDLIFPAGQGGGIAIGQKGPRLVTIQADGSESALPEGSNPPKYADLVADLSFDYLDGSSGALFYSYHDSEGDPGFFGSFDLFYVLPSYLQPLSYLPEIINNSDGEMSKTRVQGEAELLATKDNGISTFLTSFIDEGVDARGYFNQSNTLVTLDAANQRIDSVRLRENVDVHYLPVCRDNFRYRALSNNVVEVENISAAGEVHSSMTRFSYYRISKSGAIVQLESNATFHQAHFTRLEPRHFQVCWGDPVEPNDPDSYEGENDGNYLTANHLTIEDLDIMRNEIFALYGYRFQSEKWQQYFGEKDWYTPTSDNVDDQLTEQDKYNIDQILETKADMEANPEQYSQPSRTWYYPAG